MSRTFTAASAYPAPATVFPAARIHECQCQYHDCARVVLCDPSHCGDRDLDTIHVCGKCRKACR